MTINSSSAIRVCVCVCKIYTLLIETMHCLPHVVCISNCRVRILSLVNCILGCPFTFAEPAGADVCSLDQVTLTNTDQEALDDFLNSSGDEVTTESSLTSGNLNSRCCHRVQSRIIYPDKTKSAW